MRHLRILLAAGLLLPASLPAPAANAPWNVARNPGLSRDIDALHGYYDAPHMPGAMIAVLQGGELIHLKGYGFANREFDAPWTPDTLYTFFSTTKSMTCLALARLAEQGRLSLDDEIQKYLGDFPRFDRPITLRHLMNHSSGLWQDETVMHLAGVGASYSPLTLRELYDLNRKQRSLPYAPGSNYYYNDAGNRLAARIIETVTGTSFDSALRALVFEPAGMKTARTKSYEPRFFPKQASSYFLNESPKVDPATGAVPIGTIIVETSGDGASVGTIQDYIAYARFLTQAHADGSRWIDALTQPLAANSWYVPPYRYGLLDQTHRGLRVIHHGGLYGKKIAYLPKLDIWVLMMRNALDYDVASDTARMTAIIDAVLANVQGGYYLSSRNPDRDAVLGVPRNQGWTAKETGAVSGTYVEPVSGFPVRVRVVGDTSAVQLEYDFQNVTGFLARAPGKGNVVTYGASANPIRLQLSPTGPSLQYSDWPNARPLERVASERSFSDSEIDALIGRYRNDELDVLYRIERVGDRLGLQIGSGNRDSEHFELRSVAPGVAEARPAKSATYLNLGMTLRIEQAGTRVSGLVVNSSDVKGLVFHRVELSQ